MTGPEWGAVPGAQGKAVPAPGPSGTTPLRQSQAGSVWAQRLLGLTALMLLLAGAAVLAVGPLTYGTGLLAVGLLVLAIFLIGADIPGRLRRRRGQAPYSEPAPTSVPTPPPLPLPPSAPVTVPAPVSPPVRDRRQEPGPPPGAVPPPMPEPQVRAEPADTFAALPEPAAFGHSSAGQAPWTLPTATAVSGLAADAALLGDLEVRVASVVGPGHRCEEPAQPRQDAHAVGRTADGHYLIVAVADGVGQSRHADLGARVAVTCATRELATLLASGGISAIRTGWLYENIAREMAGTARGRGMTAEDVCSILVTAAIPTAPRRDGTRTMWVSWIGDVSLWLLRDGALKRQTGARKTGLSRNALSAVLPFDPDGWQEGEVPLGPGDRVALMTDGLSDALDANLAVAEFFRRRWSAAPPHPASFLHDLCFDAPGQLDDRTVAVVWCGRQATHPADADRGQRP